MAREKVEFNLENVRRLCSLNCTHEEIASYFNVSTKTVQRRYNEEADFAEAVDMGKASGKLSLRRIQMKLAEEGNSTMAIWLGKQMLGQVDKQEIDTYNQTKPIEINVIAPDLDG